MYKNLERFKESHSELNIYLGKSECFATGLPLNEYSQILSNTKIAICPGGNNFETFRYTEAAKCGCVILGQSKLDYWFYNGNPQVTVSNWDEIHSLLPRILAEPAKCQEISENAKKYYNFRLSEKAVTEYVLSVIRAKQL